VLSDKKDGIPAGLPLHIIDEHFDSSQWLAGITQTNTLQ
jgi:hypothetical protein